MEKSYNLQNDHFVILADRIKEELKDGFLFNYLKSNFIRLDKLKNEPLKLAIFGEFNAGKTSFINRLLGLSLPTKRVPTTKVITIIKYNENEKFEIEYKDKNNNSNQYSIKEYEGFSKLNEILEDNSDLIEIKEIRIYINNPILKTFEVIDTPGFNDDEFEKITKTLFDKINFAIWVFNAQQAGSNSEKSILEEFKNKSIYKNNIYAFINQADIVDEKDIENIKESLKEHQEYFMNDNIFAISAKKKDEKWNLKFNTLVEDLKLNVLNKDIEISRLQIEEEFKIIKSILNDVKVQFIDTQIKIGEKFEDFIKRNPINSKTQNSTKQNILKDIEKFIKEIKNEVEESEIYKNKFVETAIKFLSFYKTVTKLDGIDMSVKKIYITYINEFKKDYDKNIYSVLKLLNPLSLEKEFYEEIHKRFDKISFTLDMLKETKQALIVGYIIGVLTDNYIYKNLNEEDILKNLNKDVILNLIDLDLDITYFIEEIEKIKNDINNFFDKQINLLNITINKE
jgi:GTPase SAR1 family protein